MAVDQFDMGASLPGQVVIDTTGPDVLSLARFSPTTLWTNADSLTFQMTFSEQVAGVTASNFGLWSSPGTTRKSGIRRPATAA